MLRHSLRCSGREPMVAIEGTSQNRERHCDNGEVNEIPARARPQ
jgi:hypothetical protein